MNPESILDSTKKILGLDSAYTVFDHDIMIHINSVFSTLEQLGVGPDSGFQITGSSEVWGDFLGGDYRLNQVRSYVFLRVRLLFDPPQTSFAISSMSEQIKEMEWRLTTLMEPPVPVIIPESTDPFADEPIYLDGGAP